MSTRRGTTRRRTAGRALARTLVSVALATGVVVGTAMTVSADNDDESPYLVFSAPAVGANGSYTVTIPYTSSYTLPSVDIRNSDSPRTYVISGSNSAGCAVPSSGGAVSITQVGSCTVTVTATGDPDDNSNGGNSNGHEGSGNDPDSATASLTITVTRASQSISVTPQSGPVTATLPLVATGYLGTGPISFSLASGGTASGCSISGSGITATSQGTCMVTATILADSVYASATSSPAAMTFSRTGQSISLASASGFVGTTLALSASGYTGTGAITYALVSGGTATGCAVSGSGVTATGAGTCLVTASIAADSKYNGATSSPTTFTFTRHSQTIKVLGASTTVGAKVTLVATGYSGTGAITFALAAGSTATGCSLSGDHLTATGAGDCNVTATIAADSLYSSATSAVTAITFSAVPKGTLTVTASSETIDVGGSVNESAALSGLQSPDSGYVSSVTFKYTGTDPSYGPSSTPPTAPGTYTVTPSNAAIVVNPNADSTRYGSTDYESGTLVIRGKLTITASGGSITAGDHFSPTVTVSGLGTGDSATVSSVTITYTGIGATSYGPSTSVPGSPGAYSVTPSGATLAVTPGSHQSHYPGPYTYVSGTLIVTPKPVVVKVNPPAAPPLTMTVKPFAEGSYALSKKLKAQVMKIAKAVRSAHYRTVDLTGYTDNVFTPSFNVVLDLNRARAVSLQLKADLKRLRDLNVVVTIVPAPTIVTVATNSTVKGRAANRRVVATLRSS